jgi:thiol-disulfide isomerase/thioredoxin
MIRIRTAVACLSAVALAAVALVAGAARQEAQPISAELSLTAFDGRTVDFGELRGEVVLLDFWATWCKPCREATPHLVRLNRRMEGKPFVLVGVSTDQDRENLDAYLAEEGLPWPQLWDANHQLMDAFGVSSLPTYLVIDHEGRPVWLITGWGSDHGMLLDREVGRRVRQAERAARREARGGEG